MLRNDKNRLVLKLYNEINTRHRIYNDSIKEIARMAREVAIQSISNDLKEFIAIMNKRGYATFAQQIIAEMTFTTANIPQKVSESHYLETEIRVMLESINDAGKTDGEVEEELKQKIVDTYKFISNGTTSSEVQPRKAELVISPLQKLGANGQDTNVRSTKVRPW